MCIRDRSRRRRGGRRSDGGRRRIAQGASGLHFKGVGHDGPARGVLAGCAAEGMEDCAAQHKIVLLAQRDAQVTQGSFDPDPFGEKVPQVVKQRVRGLALAAIRLHHNARKQCIRRKCPCRPLRIYGDVIVGSGARDASWTRS